MKGIGVCRGPRIRPAPATSQGGSAAVDIGAVGCAGVVCTRTSHGRSLAVELHQTPELSWIACGRGCPAHGPPCRPRHCPPHRPPAGWKVRMTRSHEQGHFAPDKFPVDAALSKQCSLWCSQNGLSPCSPGQDPTVRPIAVYKCGAYRGMSCAGDLVGVLHHP